MRTPFKLRSGNTAKFKDMGSSPVKQTYTDKAKRRGFDIASIDGIATGAVPGGADGEAEGHTSTKIDATRVRKPVTPKTTSRHSKLISDEPEGAEVTPEMDKYAKDFFGKGGKQKPSKNKGLMKSFRKVKGKVAKKVTPTEGGVDKKMMKMKDSFRKQLIQKQIDPLQKELDETPRKALQGELIGKMRDEYSKAARKKPFATQPKRKLTKELKKKDNTAQENLNKNIQEGISTNY